MGVELGGGFEYAYTKLGLGFEARVHYLVTHEGAGLLTTYGGLLMAGPRSHGYRLGGRIDLSVEGERITQGSAAEHQVAFYGRSRPDPRMTLLPSSPLRP